MTTKIIHRKKCLHFHEVMAFINEIKDIDEDDIITSVSISKINEIHKINGSFTWLRYRITVISHPKDDVDDDINKAKHIGWRDRWV